jgi:hypothetical protein
LASLGTLAGTKVATLDCKSTICRIDVVHQTMADALAFQSLVGNPATRPWNGEVFLTLMAPLRK